MELFLSLLDERSKVKGSRDPLGFQLIWTYWGRKLVGNLTTITSNINNFSVSVIGLYLIDKFVNLSETEQLDCFLRFEQLAGYLRHDQSDNNILGIQRVTKNYESNDKINISIDNQILSNQKSYGLWGLYYVALEDTGLAKNRKLKYNNLPEQIKNNIKQYFNNNEEMLNKIKNNTVIKKEWIQNRSKNFMKLLNNMKTLLLEEILEGNNSDFCYQRELFEYLKNKENISDYTPTILIKELVKSNNKNLSKISKNIIKIDETMMVANRIFNYLRNAENHENKIDDIAQKLENTTVIDSRIDDPFLPEIPHIPNNNLDIIKDFRKNFNSRNFKKAIEKLYKQNKDVMQGRNNSAPWLEITNNKLDIKISNNNAKVPNNLNLKELEYTYFLESYLNLINARENK